MPVRENFDIVQLGDAGRTGFPVEGARLPCTSSVGSTCGVVADPFVGPVGSGLRGRRNRNRNVRQRAHAKLRKLGGFCYSAMIVDDKFWESTRLIGPFPSWLALLQTPDDMVNVSAMCRLRVARSSGTVWHVDDCGDHLLSDVFLSLVRLNGLARPIWLKGVGEQEILSFSECPQLEHTVGAMVSRPTYDFQDMYNLRLSPMVAQQELVFSTDLVLKPEVFERLEICERVVEQPVQQVEEFDEGFCYLELLDDKFAKLIGDVHGSMITWLQLIRLPCEVIDEEKLSRLRVDVGPDFSHLSAFGEFSLNDFLVDLCIYEGVAIPEWCIVNVVGTTPISELPHLDGMLAGKAQWDSEPLFIEVIPDHGVNPVVNRVAWLDDAVSLCELSSRNIAQIQECASHITVPENGFDPWTAAIFPYGLPRGCRVRVRDSWMSYENRSVWFIGYGDLNIEIHASPSVDLRSVRFYEYHFSISSLPVNVGFQSRLAAYLQSDFIRVDNMVASMRMASDDIVVVRDSAAKRIAQCFLRDKFIVYTMDELLRTNQVHRAICVLRLIMCGAFRDCDYSRLRSIRKLCCGRFLYLTTSDELDVVDKVVAENRHGSVRHKL